MLAEMYRFPSAIVAMVGVAVGLFVKGSETIDRLEELLEMPRKES